MSKTIASLSLDLDNKWSYLRTHGCDSWEDYPSYLGAVVPRIADFFAQYGVRATVFVVGKDLDFEENQEAVGRFLDAGCELGNHSQNHYPWLKTLPLKKIESEIVEAEQAIERLSGARPFGFRGPGFSWSEEMHGILARRGYLYDASCLPTVVGPLARLYSKLRMPVRSKKDLSERPQSFADIKDAMRPLRPHRIDTTGGNLIEVPVTTMPLMRAPIHATYLTFLAQSSKTVAKNYFRMALRLCRLRDVAPSILLHPLDFLGSEDEPDLAFFPGMKLRRQVKLELLGWMMRALQETWRLETLANHVGEVCGSQPAATPSGARDPEPAITAP